MNEYEYVNHDKPLIMHIDLNSCFATIEQQANPLLRGKPLVVAAYDTPNAFILAPSIEAKRLGIKMGMRIRDAWEVTRDIVVRMPNPPLYRDVHQKFKKIFLDYSPDVIPKSIDEAIIDFHSTANLHTNLIAAAKEIKQRMKDEIGEWIFCSIGIGTNMFLAKLGASLHKPDGLTLIDHSNLLDTYKSAELLDFCGINVRYQLRLNMNGIYTPIDFFNATREKLYKHVFRSIVGARWYDKLRGFEADQRDFPTRSIGHQYAIHIATADKAELSRLIMKLCEKMGRRLRSKGYVARGMHMWLAYNDYTGWHRGKLMDRDMYTTLELYRAAKYLFDNQPNLRPVRQLGVSCYRLNEHDSRQLHLFEGEEYKKRDVSDAADTLNDKYGEFTVIPGLMIEMDNIILDRIAFGGVRDLEFHI